MERNLDGFKVKELWNSPISLVCVQKREEEATQRLIYKLSLESRRQGEPGEDGQNREPGTSMNLRRSTRHQLGKRRQYALQN